MSLSLRRYQQSPKNASSFVLTTRNTTSKQKITPMNSSVSLPKNPEMIDIKLPSLTRSSMRKSFSTFQSDRNTKFKLQTLQQKLEQIKHHLHNTRQQEKETIQFTAVLKQGLIDKELNNITKDLKQKIQGLQNFVKITIHDNKTRSNQLRDNCGKLWDQTQDIKSMTFELRMKVQAIQRNMGYKQ